MSGEFLKMVQILGQTLTQRYKYASVNAMPAPSRLCKGLS